MSQDVEEMKANRQDIPAAYDRVGITEAFQGLETLVTHVIKMEKTIALWLGISNLGEQTMEVELRRNILRDVRRR
eukprot:TRINITY_DN15308_c0_g1_i1.p3 TRINITY_DN15308_c0_g1~~TRINITY_DN15308_c0_g1_i1.p3  ORF type:complete len:75 (+),score=8.01 TRINITY_DN15308_c0_g1_i1:291-515(+)